MFELKPSFRAKLDARFFMFPIKLLVITGGREGQRKRFRFTPSSPGSSLGSDVTMKLS